MLDTVGTYSYHFTPEEAQKILPVRDVVWTKEAEAFYYSTGKCEVCGRYGTPGESLERDHWKPLSKGGTSDLRNLRVLCGDCNDSKDDKTPQVWLEEVGDADSPWYIPSC